jgi:hypothetical protein
MEASVVRLNVNGFLMRGDFISDFVEVKRDGGE